MMLKRLATLLLGIGLIGLGVLFFIAPERAFAVQLLVRFWPIFLILAGSVRVAGYLIDRHPRSPVGGMMIAATGGILLSANLLGDRSFAAILGKYWFWLLLAFIAGRLLKQYTHRLEGGVRPNAFAPGAIVAMILIVGGGLGANYLAKRGQGGLHLQIGRIGDVSNYIFGNKIAIEGEIQTFGIAPDARLIINDAKGDVEVNSSPQMQASARLIKRLRAANEEEARSIAANIVLQIASDSNNYQFNVRAGDLQQEVETTLLISIPQNLAGNVEIHNAAGAVKLNGLRGDHIIRNCRSVEASDNSGRVTVENPLGSVELSRIEGEVSLVNSVRDAILQEINGPITVDVRGGSLSLEKSKGPVQLQSSESRIEISRIGGDSSELSNQAVINIEKSNNSRIKLQNIRGGVSIKSHRTRIDAEDVTGDLTLSGSSERIYLSQIIGALRVKSDNGSVEVEEISGAANIESTRDIRVRKFRGPLTINSRQGTISLETSEKITDDVKAINDRGQIRISIPEDSGFRLDAHAGNGRVRLNGFDDITLSRQERSSAIGYNLSESGPLITLRSGGGEIRLQSSGLAIAIRD